MGHIYGTYLGGLIAHLITAGPWVVGAAVIFGPLYLCFVGRIIEGSALLGLASVQYIIRIPKWPAFAKFLKDLGPRSYYKACTLSVDLKNVHSEKVGTHCHFIENLGT